jgi:hypothetical protein
LGDGEWLRPGGVLLPRLVTGAGVLTAGDDPNGDELDPGEDRLEEGEDAGGGRIAGSGARVAPAPESAVPGDPAGDAPRTDHGMIEARGPPSRPTAITTRHASKTAPAPRPSRRIRRRRRPETSANTGVWQAGC